MSVSRCMSLKRGSRLASMQIRQFTPVRSSFLLLVSGNITFRHWREHALEVNGWCVCHISSAANTDTASSPSLAAPGAVQMLVRETIIEEAVLVGRELIARAQFGNKVLARGLPF